MKKSLLLLAMMSSSAFAGVIVPTLVIEGVMDGPLPGGNPKMVEIYVVSGGELDQCGIGSANNGGGSDGEEFTFPTRTVTAGEHITVSASASGKGDQFLEYFGVVADYAGESAVSINGDDAVELFCDGVVVDLFGDINVDGTGQVWDHLDGWAHRNMVDNPPTPVRGAPVFDPSNWTFSGPNAVDGCTTNASCTDAVYPKGTLPIELMNFSVE